MKWNQTGTYINQQLNTTFAKSKSRYGIGHTGAAVILCDFQRIREMVVPENLIITGSLI